MRGDGRSIFEECSVFHTVLHTIKIYNFFNMVEEQKKMNFHINQRLMSFKWQSM